MSALGLLLAASASLGGENRLWWVELELRGACAEVRLDCGAEGETRLRGPFASGEDRRLLVAVPVRSPPGAAGLTALPLPRAEVLPPGAVGTARVLAWSARQPAALLEPLREGLGEGLGTLAFPPVRSGAPVAGSVELLLVLAAGLGLFALRRRPAACLVLALLASALAFSLARSRRAASGETRVLAWRAGDEFALARAAGADRIALPRAALEVLPAGRRLEFEQDGGGGDGWASAPGARLVALEGVPAPALARERNGDQDLLEVWTRTPAGAWRTHGPWPRGTALPAALAPGVDHTAPPGWLSGGLAPGRSVLLGRGADGAWLCCLGFESE